MPDQRTAVERVLWERIGPPLYYCADCLRAVKVEPVEGAEPRITRPCGPECGTEVIAPRKAICVGEGGMSLGQRVETAYNQVKAALTGRCA